MPYVLTDNQGNYIKQNNGNGYSAVSNLSLAIRFDTLKQAKSVKMNCLNKNLRKRYNIQYIKELDVIKNKKSETDKKEINLDKLKELAEVNVDDTSFECMNSNVGYVVGLIINADEQLDKEQKMLDLCEKQILDLYHFIEFNELNAYQGWLVQKALKNTLKIRRLAKDKIQILKAIKSLEISTNQIGNLQTVLNDIKNRHYSPRVLKDIF